METLNLPTSVINSYKRNFMVRIPVYDAYVDALEQESEVEINREYFCLDCNDTRKVADYYFDFDSKMMYEDGERDCICTY